MSNQSRCSRPRGRETVEELRSTPEGYSPFKATWPRRSRLIRAACRLDFVSDLGASWNGWWRGSEQSVSSDVVGGTTVGIGGVAKECSTGNRQLAVLGDGAAVGECGIAREDASRDRTTLDPLRWLRLRARRGRTKGADADAG